MLVEQSVVWLASTGKRLRAFANERNEPIERRREQPIGVLLACLLPGAERLRFCIGELTHQIFRQRERMAPQPPEQRKLARKPHVAFGLRCDLLDQIAKPVRYQHRMANAFERRQLPAAFGASRRRQHGFLIPVEQRDRLLEVAKFGDLRAQRLRQRLGASNGTARDAQLGRRFGLEHRGKPTALRDIDDLLLRNPAHRAEAVLGRGKPHHRIKRLAKDATVRAENRKFVHRKTRRTLNHP